MALSGCEFGGRSIRIGRPTDYAAPTLELVQKLEGSGILGIPGDAGVVAMPAPAMVGGAPADDGPDISAASTVVSWPDAPLP